jgi:hypothetical protein
MTATFERNPMHDPTTAVAELVPGHGLVLGRRAVLVGALGLTGTALVGVRAAEAAPRVAGGILETYLAAGGQDVLGVALHDQVKRRLAHANTYAQRFEHGTVWWGSGKGLVDRPAARVHLRSAPNFRPVLGVRDLWRTDDLDGCSGLEQRVVIDLGITMMIAMNSGSDPSIPGVLRKQYKISNDGSHLDFYRSYVTREKSRVAFGKVLSRVARSDEPVLVHCRAGKDRTGWVCDLMQSVAGVSQDVRDHDYLATRTYYPGKDVDLAWLTAARTQLESDYGTVSDYLVDGCGLSAADLRLLGQRLG